MAKQINVLALMTIIFFAAAAHATTLDSILGSNGLDAVNEDIKRLKEQYGDSITVTPGGGIISNIPFQGVPADWFKPIKPGEDGVNPVPTAYEDYANIEIDTETPAPAPAPGPTNEGLGKYYIKY